MLEPGTILDGKYQIAAVIGQGGFGYVYRARERLTGETFAIKELVPAFVDDPAVVQRFIQEARATLRLTHAHIVRTHGIFEDHGTYYLAMEYLGGGSLADRLKRGPLPMEEAVRIAGELCEALAYAHDRGVVHCDIKPANVLFDEQGEARLADFGIAHVSAKMMTRELLTATGMAMGTVRYMAPEQLEGVRNDPRLDIYAVGALLYEMLAGRPYLDFETESTPVAQVRNIQRIQTERPRPLRSSNPDVPEWLVAVVERALRKAPGERFSGANELLNTLDRSARSPHGPAREKPAGFAQESEPIRKPDPHASAGPGLRALPVWGWVLGGLAVLALLVGSVVWLQGVIGGASVAEPSGTATHVPPTELPFAGAPPTEASLGDTWTRPTDGMVMVHVPVDEFQMGSTDDEVDAAMDLCSRYWDDCSPAVFEREQPVHPVVLDAFWFDRTEVTNAQYARCVAAGECDESDYADDSRFNGADYPVVGVNWYNAAAYCEWAGARLPKEAEWEYAARGPEGRAFPWGDRFDGSRLNFCDADCEYDWKAAEYEDGYAYTAPVGSYADGASWCGALDLAGNVWEWVADWYGGYPSERQVNPTGPSSGETRVLRGGSWGDSPYGTRSAFRIWIDPGHTRHGVGFRCASGSH